MFSNIIGIDNDEYFFMKSQIFKSIVPITILFELLEKICVKDEKYYHLSKSSFKAAEYHNLVTDFCSKIIEHYHLSKRYYVDRKMNYNKFVTVIRQVCSVNNVSYTSKILYNKSDYDILYTISKEYEEPKAHEEEPKAHAEEPKAHAEEPKAHAEEISSHAEEPKAHVEEPRTKEQLQNAQIDISNNTM